MTPIVVHPPKKTERDRKRKNENESSSGFHSCSFFYQVRPSHLASWQEFQCSTNNPQQLLIHWIMLQFHWNSIQKTKHIAIITNSWEEINILPSSPIPEKTNTLPSSPIPEKINHSHQVHHLHCRWWTNIPQSKQKNNVALSHGHHIPIARGFTQHTPKSPVPTTVIITAKLWII